MLAAPERLRCEYLRNPLGVDALRPRLSWWPNDDRPAEVQTAYQIIAADSEAALRSACADADSAAAVTGPVLWDSGRVDSAQTVNIDYGGLPLRATQRIYWSVRSFDSDGEASAFSEAGWFETGLISERWVANWVGTPLQGSKDRGAAVPALRRAFELPADDGVASARLYITALGVYRPLLNGARVGHDELAPGWTDYDRRLNYQIYDVTDQLRPGSNALGVLLGDGWYAGGIGLAGRQCYGDRPALLAQLEVELDSGETVQVVSDGSWSWHASEILGSDLLDGESVDGRQRLGDWEFAVLSCS